MFADALASPREGSHGTRRARVFAHGDRITLADRSRSFATRAYV
jgi:hypothetical protein